MKKMLLISVLLLMLFSCAAQSKKATKGSSSKPKWLENPKSVYPENQYLTAIGEGDSHQTAQNMAAGNLSRIFEMKVQADETILQRASELVTAKETKVQEGVDITKQVNIFSAQELINVQYADSYTNEYGRIFVLAYLNRLRTAEIYEEKIDTNSTQIEFYMNEMNKETDILHQYAYLNAANIIAETNFVLLEQLGIISSMNRQLITLPYNANDLKRNKVDLAKSIRFDIQIQGDDENKIKIQLQELLTGMGFTSGVNGNLLISGAMNLQDTDLKSNDGFEFLRFDLQLTMKTNQGDVIAALTKNGREGHTSKREAAARIFRKLSTDIKNDFRKKIEGYFDRLVIR
jgi:hypothetical protein